VCCARLRVLQPGQHADKLPHSVVSFDHLDTRGGYCPISPLGHDHMLVGEGRDLWQVGDHDHLSLSRKPREPPPHFDGNLAADPGINLVKHKRGYSMTVSQNDFDRQHDAGQLATGCSPTERPEVATRMRA